jgi:hypothetical protein
MGVVGNELPPASFAAVALFLIGGCAILNDVPRGTRRAIDFFVAHQLEE